MISLLPSCESGLGRPLARTCKMDRVTDRLTGNDEAVLLEPGDLINQRLVPDFGARLEHRRLPREQLGLNGVCRGRCHDMQTSTAKMCLNEELLGLKAGELGDKAERVLIDHSREECASVVCEFRDVGLVTRCHEAVRLQLATMDRVRYRVLYPK